MKKIWKRFFCSVLSVSMMVQYYCPVFAQDEVVETTNQESITSADLLNKIDEVTIQERENASKEVKIDVTFNDDSGISDVSLNVENEETINIENPEINDNVYIFTSEFEVGTYSIDSISLTYEQEEYKIDLNEKFNDLTFVVKNLEEDSTNTEDQIVVNNETNGTCGDNLTWTLSDDGLLTITGSGNMYDYTYSSPAPWNGSKDLIKSVSLPDELTKIGNNAFCGCNKLTNITIPSKVKNIGVWAFYRCSGLTSITIPNSVTNIGAQAFDFCSGLVSIEVEEGNIAYDSRDNCNAIIMIYSNALMFGCKNTIIPASVTTIKEYAFEGSGLTSITIPSSVTSIGARAFSNCSGLTSIIVDENNTVYDSRNDCNAIINTSINELAASCKNSTIPTSVTSIGAKAFYQCAGLTSITIPSSVTSIGDSAFWNCYNLTSITVPSSVTSIAANAFDNSYLLKAIRLYKNSTADAYFDDTYNKVYLDEIPSEDDSLYSGISGSLIWSIDSNGLLQIKGKGNYDLDGEDGQQPKWCDYADKISSAVVNVSGITKTQYMFKNCSNLEDLDLRDLDTSEVTDMTEMFSGCQALENLDLSNFDTSKVTFMYLMFYNCSSLTSLDLSSFNTSNVTGMGMMFSNCHALTSLDISSFNTDKVQSMNAMFYQCYDLTSLDVSNFNTSNVTNVALMFCGCHQLTSLDVSSFDTGNVTTMNDMFDGCHALTSLDVSSFDTSAVTTMWGMFCECQVLTSLDVSSFDTSNVTNMGRMFYGCHALTDLDLSNFDTSSVTDLASMFRECENLSTNITLAINSDCIYSCCFYDSAIEENAKIYVKYSGECTKELAEEVIDTASVSSHVYLYDPNVQLEGYSLSLSGNIGVNFYMHLNENVIEDKNAFMEFSLPNNRNKTQIVYIKDLKPNDDGNYVFRCNVSAKEMTVTVQARIHYGDGTVGTKYMYTVNQYANYILNNYSSSSKEYKIAKAMLTYGAYTQDYFEYKVKRKPTPVNSLQAFDLKSYKYVLSDSNSDISFVGDD